MAAQVGPGEADRAGRSAQVEYDRRYAQWRASRWQTSLRWLPPALLLAAAGGWYLTATTGFRLFGVVFATMVIGFTLDALYRPPQLLTDWRRAASAERATGRLFTRSNRDGYVVLHDRRTARGRVDVEHLVAGPTGMFVLDSRNWSTVTEPLRVQSGRFWIGREEQTDLLEGLRGEAAQVAREVGDLVDPAVVPGRLSATPVVVVHGAKVSGTPRVIGGVAVVESNQLLRYLSRSEPVWRPEQVRYVAAAAERVLRVKEA